MNQLCACRSVSGALSLTALCGLLSALPAHAQEVPMRAAPPPGMALVYIFRIDPEPVAARVPVVVNTVLVGELANGTFITATVGPGRTYLRIGDRVLSTLSFVTAASRIEGQEGAERRRANAPRHHETRPSALHEQDRFAHRFEPSLRALE